MQPPPPHSSRLTSSLQPLASVSPPLVSSNNLFNRCKGARDYRERTRIIFPGGWVKGDEMDQWYRSQPHWRFQTIEYCKEKSRVQHEFIRVLLQNRRGDLVGSFCRLERVADVERRIEAITNGGTTAFDFVQTIDPDNPIDSEHPNLSADNDSSVEVVAQISFPCVLELYYILAICYGIQKHPRARNYTLQQFNCYFFSWTIILCLARYTAGWTKIIHNHVETLRDDIFRHISGLHSSGAVTVWSLVFGLHGRQSDTMSAHHVDQLQLIETISSKITSEALIGVMERVLLPLLWHDQSPARLQSGLQPILRTIARETGDPLLKDSFVSPRKSNIFATLQLGAFQSELVRICMTDCGKRMFLPKETSACIKEFAMYNAERAGKLPVSLRTKHIVLSHCELFIALTIVTPPFLIFGAILLLTNSYEHQISIERERERRMFIRKPLALFKTIKQGPKTLYSGLKWYRQFVRLYYVDCLHENLRSLVSDQEGALSVPEPRIRIDGRTLALSVLNDGLKTYTFRHGGNSATDLRKMCIETMEYFCMVFMSKEDQRPKMDELWKLSFSDDLGSVIARSILDVIKQPTSASGLPFQWVSYSKTHNGHPTSEATVLQLSHAELQNHIRKRIVQLSKWEVEGSPIVPYMRHVPFTTPAKESQGEMERTIEEIWNTCGPLMENRRQGS